MPEFKLLEEEQFGPALPVKYTQVQVINIAKAA